jgi:uncharacterized protein (TIRG00374 family)
MQPKTKKLIITGLRILVCVVALWWVLQSVTLHDYVTLRDGRRARLIELGDTTARIQIEAEPIRDVAVAELATGEDGGPRIEYGLTSVLRGSYKRYLLLAVLLFSPVPLLQSLRFLMMYRAQDIRLSYWECTKLCFAGNFLNFVALGSTGGDVVKAYYVCLHTDRRTEAVTTILLDRIVGLTGLLTLVGIIIPIFANDTRMRMFGLVIAVFLVVVVAGSILLVSENARRVVRRLLPLSRIDGAVSDAGASTGGLTRRLLALGAWILGQARRVDQTTQRLIKHKPMVIGSILVTMVLQLIALTSWQAIVYALRMPWNLSLAGDYFAYFGGANVVACVPITFQGLGTVEAYYKELLAGPGVTVAQILCFAMATRVLQLVWSLPGVLVTMTGSYKPRDAAAADPAGANGP